MRRPADIERLYIDFDGFFASVEQQAHRHLRGKPVGVVPFKDAEHTCVIACSREAKLRGVKNVMNIAEARERCPDIILVPQSPDLYRRAHNTLLSEISAVIPIDAVKSIDELTCRISPSERGDPCALGLRIKKRVADNIGPFITCSIGFAANRQLAKMACKAGKPNGNMVWHPDDMPGPLLKLTLRDIPGIGGRMEQRLMRFGITSIASLLATQPKHMRKLWGNVTGERLWYALHGYDVQTPASGRGMYGHGRVLPPDYRTAEHAKSASRLLLIKTARRMRRDGWNAGRVWLWLELMGDDSVHRSAWLPAVHDDQAVLTALEGLWANARGSLPRRARILRLGVTLLELTPAKERQLDILLNDDKKRRQCEKATAAMDALNRKYGRTLVSIGPWTPPPGGYAGGKISYTRIPRVEDFW
ncbi:MAG: type VI secretion protein ImpB [Rhizobiales bacterium]|nr:type VI secretion protein ImpB [Hyphomicrobiales bacterium]